MKNICIGSMILLCLVVVESRAQNVTNDYVPTRSISAKPDSIKRATLREVLEQYYNFTDPKIEVILENRLLSRKDILAFPGMTTSDQKKLLLIRNQLLVSDDARIHKLLQAERLTSPFSLAKKYTRQAFLQLDTSISLEVRNRAYSNSEILNSTVNRLMTSDILGRVSYSDILQGLDSPQQAEEEDIKEWYESLLPDECTKCDENSDVFSPAVYLIYLLDFLKDSFGEDLNSQDKINDFFYTNFEELPLDQDLAESGSYVKYTNQILENYYSVQFLNDRIIHSEALSVNQKRRKQERIYALFSSVDVPYPDLMDEQFEDYVSAFGTSRRKVKFIRRGNNTLIDKFLAETALTLDEFNAINVDRASYSNLLEIKEKFLSHHERKMNIIVRQEMLADIDDEYRINFLKVYRNNVQDEIDDLLLDKLNTSSTYSEQQFNTYKSQAALCVKLGLECDSLGVAGWEDKYPLYPIKALYKEYARFFPDSPDYTNDDEFAEEKFNQLRTALEEIYLAEELLNLDTSVIEFQQVEDSLKVNVERRVEERLYTEDEFDRQLYILDSLILESTLEDPENKAAFDDEVTRRAEEQWLVACNKAEIGFQEKLRANLLALIDARDDSLDFNKPKAMEALADSLLIDLTITEASKTTPFAFALSRIHTFVQKARLGVFRSQFTNLAEADEARWQWLKSYGIWHAAMMVHLYPENFLFPEIDPELSPDFEALKEMYADRLPNEIENVEKYYKELINEIGKDVCGAINVNEVLHIFSYNKSLDKLYHLAQKEDGSWTFWKQINTALPDDFIGKGDIMPLVSDSYITFFSVGGSKEDDFTLFYQKYKISRDQLIPIKDQWTEIEDVVIPPIVPTIGNNIGLFKYKNSSSIAVEYTTPVFGTQVEYETIGNFTIYRLGENREDTTNWQANRYTLNVKDDEITLKHHIPIYREVGIAPNIKSDIFGTVGVFFSDFYKQGRWYFELVDSTHKSISLDTIGSNYVLFNYPNSLPSFFYVKDQVLHERELKLSQGNYDYELGNENKLGNLIGLERFYKDDFYIVENQSGLNMVADGFIWSIPPQTDGEIKVIDSENLEYILPPFEVFSTVLKIIPNLFLSVPEIDLFEKYEPNSLPRKYLEEYELKLPIWLAERLNEEERFEEAFKVLSRVYDPMEASEEDRIKYPGFFDAREEAVWGQISADPFDPFAMAEGDKIKYLLQVKYKHVENLLDWADYLFSLDSPESVNRARELYELAGSVLNLANFPEAECAVGLVDYKDQAIEVRNFIDELRSQGACDAFILEVNRIIEGKGTKSMKLQKLKQLRIQEICDRSNGKIASLRTKKQVFVEDKTTRNQVSAYEQRLLDILSAQDQQGDLVTLEIGTNRTGPELQPFCIPRNPLINIYKFHIESNLQKIRTNRNFAGYQRSLQFYATPVDPAKLVRAAARGNLDFEDYVPTSPPPVYRYSFLLERSRYLAEQAKSLESLLLNTFKELDNETYTYHRAKQDLALEKANVSLQRLRVNEANDYIRQAQKQLERVDEQFEYYEELLDEGYSGLENTAIGFMIGAAASYGAAAAVGGATLASPVPNSDQAQLVMSSLSNSGSAASTTASILQTYASYQRRTREWEFQKKLAEIDQKIADIGIDLAEDRRDIVEKEEEISEIRQQYAEDNLEFLNDEKFTNREFYTWMKKELKRLYRHTYNQAFAIALAAQKALEFEQQATVDFIQYDYWDDEREGILASQRLLNALNNLEQHRLSTATRKKEIEKTFSLAQKVPVAFERFRNTGVLDFEILEEWFDRDYPGHYMRLIKDVNVSVVALVPPMEGIKATLSNPGISRTMVGPPYEESTVILRSPESIAISRANNDNGLFNLQPNDPMLLPFEGSGVATSWTLEMPKGANPFDYNTIADVIFTIRYTAKEDRGYRDKLLENWAQDEFGYVQTSSNRAFSIKNEFPDQWYHLQNPIIGVDSLDYYYPVEDKISEERKYQAPYTIVLDLQKNDFLHNEENKRISNVSLIAKYAQGYFPNEDTSIPLKMAFYPAGGLKQNTENISISSFENSTQSYNGQAPFGKWAFRLDVEDRSNPFLYPIQLESSVNKVDLSNLEDLILVIEYRAKVHYNR